MRAASFLISTGLLEEVLFLPTGAHIVGARMVGADRIEFIADDPALPEADAPHIADPTARAIQWDWNLT